MVSSALAVVPHGNQAMNRSPNGPEISYHLGPDLTLFFSLRCPSCRRVHEHRAEELTLGRVIACPCGVELEIDDPEFVQLQRDLKRRRIGQR